MLVTSVLILFYYLFFFVLFNVIFQIPISFILAHPIHPSNSLPVVRSLSVSLSFVSSQSLSCSYILYIYSRSYSLSLSRFSLLIYILLRVAGFPLFPLLFCVRLERVVLFCVSPQKYCGIVQVFRERLKVLHSKITARNERIKLLMQRGSPDVVPLDPVET